MKILHCVNKMDAGGIETLIMRLFRKYSQEQKDIVFDFLLVDTQKGIYDDEIIAMGGNLLYLPPLRYKNPIKLLCDLKKRKTSFENIKGYDIIHIHSSQCFSAFNRAKQALKTDARKVVVHSHNSGGSNHVLNNIFKKKIDKLKITRLACSEKAGKWMFGTSFEIFYNGIELEKFSYDEKKRQESRAELGLDNCFVIGNVGRYVYQKNHEYLLKIFAEYVKDNEEARLVIIGKGELEKDIDNQIIDLGIQDKVKKFDVRNDLERIYQAFDVFCLPSRYEGLGIVLIEAQAAGLPCLISKNIPLEATISERVEYLDIDESSIPIWIEKLNKISKQKRCLVLPNSNYNNFDLDCVAKKLLEIYEA